MDKPEQMELIASNNELAAFDQAVDFELRDAEELFPLFPTDPIHMVAVMTEEAGECTRAALKHVYEGKPIENIQVELVQCAAVCRRACIAIERIKATTPQEATDGDN
jgi:hypothetical protein